VGISSESDSRALTGRGFLSGCFERNPMKKKQKPAKKSRPAPKQKVQNERLKGWNESPAFSANRLPWRNDGRDQACP
jgi:hypothetical protein